MPTSTYEKIRTYTVPSSTASYTFSTISSAYTDLRLIGSGITSTTGYAFTLGVNGDTGSNYSQTLISGNGSSAGSGRYSNATNTSMYWGGWVNGDDSTARTTQTADFQNYSNSTTYKSILWRSSSGTRNREAGVILWRNTNAISSIYINAASGFWSGSTFTLYGIKAA